MLPIFFTKMCHFHKSYYLSKENHNLYDKNAEGHVKVV